MADDGGKKPIDILLDRVEWQIIDGTVPPGDVPYTTHVGLLDFGGVSLRVYQLSDGQRIIDAEDFNALFGARLIPPSDPSSPLLGEETKET